MHLARREMAIAVQEWLAVIPHFELDSDATLQERGGGAMMALETLPLRWEVELVKLQVTHRVPGPRTLLLARPAVSSSPTTRAS